MRKGKALVVLWVEIPFLFLIPMYLIFKENKSQTKGRDANGQAVEARTGNLEKA